MNLSEKKYKLKWINEADINDDMGDLMLWRYKDVKEFIKRRNDIIMNDDEWKLGKNMQECALILKNKLDKLAGEELAGGKNDR